MGINFKKLLLGILVTANISTANAQIDSVTSDRIEVAKPKSQLIKKAIIPAAFLGYGAISLGSGSLIQFDHYVNNSAIGGHGYSGSADDYLRYGPIAAVYGLDLLGVKAKNNFIDRSAMLLMSMAIASSAVTFTKNNIYRLRPDGSGVRSFPSSHTAMAFMAAEFMHQEYGEKSIWFSVIGYGTATFTGVLRMYHHVHWFSDVIMGAGYGILATKLSYLIYPYLKQIFIPKKNMNFVLSPNLIDTHPGFSMSLKL
jgi:hypothetical protein